MGIDIYAKWEAMTEAEQEAQSTGFSVAHGHVGYLREAYHGAPYATHILVPEAFDDPTGYGVGIEAASHQHLSQLPQRLQDAIIANCGNYIVFRIGAQDARVLAAELGIDNAHTLCDTRNFSAWAKLLQDGNPTDPFLMDTSEPEPPERKRSAAVIAHTRARHTRDRASVENMIARQLEN